MPADSLGDAWKADLCGAASCQMAGRCMHRGSCEIEDEDDGDTGEDTMPDSQFIYLLNAMEHAAQEKNPAEHGYGDKRRAVLEYVSKLEGGQRSETTTRPRPDHPEDTVAVLLDAERYRWLRDECGHERRIEIAEYATKPYLLDHHIDKGRCGL